MSVLQTGNQYKLFKIGAHRGDNLHTTITASDRVLFVEPIKELYDILKKRFNTQYPNNNFVYVNKACSDTVGKLTLYVPDVEVLTNDTEPYYIEREWVSYIDQLSSVHKDHVKDHDINVPTKKVEVECVTVDWLIEKYQVSAIERIVIDTEGNDHRVIKGINNVYPDYIVFENKHIDGTNNKMKGKNYIQTINKLKSIGYKIDKQDSEDTYLSKT